MCAASQSMQRPNDRQARDFGPGPSLRTTESTLPPAVLAANDNPRRGPNYSSALPSDAFAIIEPVLTGVNQPGRARSGLWRLRFPERWSPRPDPLMGWTGGGDPLSHVELRFPSVEAAKSYCRREGIPFELRGLTNSACLKISRLEGEAPPQLCCWPTGPHAMCCGDLVSGWTALRPSDRATG